MAGPDERQVSDLEELLASTRSRMETICGDFVEATAAALTDYWPRYLDQCIAENGAALVAMSDEAVAALKREVEQRIADPGLACQTEMVDRNPEMWPHLLTREDLLERARDPLNGLGRISFDPTETEGRSPALMGFVERVTGIVAAPFYATGLTPPLSRIDEEGRCVTFGLSWTMEMRNASERYYSEVLLLNETAHELDKLLKRSADQQFKDRWDRA